MSKLKQIHDYLVSKGRKKEDLEKLDKYSIYLSMEIMEYCHRNMKLDSNMDYSFHPSRCLNIYQEFIGCKPDDYFSVDKDLLYEYQIPFDGVQEVCLLHDILNTNELDINDLEEIFDEVELGDYFRLYIKESLIILKYDDSKSFKDNVKNSLSNPISALVKMIELQDNINILNLNSFNEDKYNELSDYILYVYLINDCYKFIEHIYEYRNMFNEGL